MGVLTASVIAPAREVLGDFVEAVALHSFVACIGCGSLAYVGA